MVMEYEPGSYAARVSPAPLMMVVAHHLAMADEALRAFNEALEPKRLVTLAGGRFDAYVSDFEAAATPARDWFVTHLMR